MSSRTRSSAECPVPGPSGSAPSAPALRALLSVLLRRGLVLLGRLLHGRGFMLLARGGLLLLGGGFGARRGGRVGLGPRRAGRRRGTAGAAAARRGGGGLFFDQFDDGERRVVTLARPDLGDPRVTALAGGEPRPDLGEQGMHDAP